jgi:hypothetical protein
MGNVRITRMPHLTLMCIAAEFDSFADVLNILRLKIGRDFLDE